MRLTLIFRLQIRDEIHFVYEMTTLRDKHL